MNQHWSQALFGIAAATSLSACLVYAGGEVDETTSSPVGSACPLGGTGCITCSEYFGNNACSEADLCADSFVVHEQAHSCMCTHCPDECADRCGDESAELSRQCLTCVLDRCNTAADACAND